MARRKVCTTVYLTQEQVEALKALSEKTRVPQSEYIREAVSDVLKKHGAKPPAEPEP
jgi:predicted DNA-binding protein